MSKNILMIDANILKERTQIHTNIDDKLLYPEIKVAQDMYIHPALGTRLYDRILNDIDNNTLTGNYKNLVDDYIIDVLIWYVLKQLPLPLTVQFWNKGVAISTDANAQTISMEDMMKVGDMFQNRAEWYENRLRLYLAEDNATMFPEWDEFGNRLDELHPNRRSFQMPIFLGDHDCPPKGVPVYFDPTKCYGR